MEEDGSRGVNYWYKKLDNGEYHKKSLGGKCTVRVGKGDRIVIMTPGGGGFGVIDHEVNYPIKSSHPSVLTGSVGLRTITQETN